MVGSGKIIPINTKEIAAIREVVGDADIRLLRDALATLHDDGAIDIDGGKKKNYNLKVKRFSSVFTVPRFSDKILNAAVSYFFIYLLQQAYLLLVVDAISGYLTVIITAALTFVLAISYIVSMGVIGDKGEKVGKPFTITTAVAYVMIEFLLLLQLVFADLDRQFEVLEGYNLNLPEGVTRLGAPNKLSIVPYLYSARSLFNTTLFPSPFPFRAQSFLGEARRSIVPEVYFCTRGVNTTFLTQNSKLEYRTTLDCLSSAFAPDVVGVFAVGYIWMMSKSNLTLNFTLLLSTLSYVLYLAVAAVFSTAFNYVPLSLITLSWVCTVALTTSGFSDFYSLFAEKVASAEEDFQLSVDEVEKTKKDEQMRSTRKFNFLVHSLHLLMSMINDLATRLADKAILDRSAFYSGNDAAGVKANVTGTGVEMPTPRRTKRTEDPLALPSSARLDGEGEEEGEGEGGGGEKKEVAVNDGEGQRRGGGGGGTLLNAGQSLLAKAETRLAAKSNVNSALLALSGLRSARFFLDNIQLFGRLQVGPIRTKRTVFNALKAVEDAVKPFYIDAARKGIDVMFGVEVRRVVESEVRFESSLSGKGAIQSRNSMLAKVRDEEEEAEEERRKKMEEKEGEGKKGKKKKEKKEKKGEKKEGEEEEESGSKSEEKEGEEEEEGEKKEGEGSDEKGGEEKDREEAATLPFDDDESHLPFNKKKKHPLKDLTEEMIIEAAPHEALFVKADKTLLAKAISIVMDNAVKYSDGGTIRVSMTVKWYDLGRVKLRLIVADEGKGIHEADLERIFSPVALEGGAKGEEMQGLYYENANSRTLLRGLSLYIARNIARTFDGDITVKSTVGRGSIFILSAVMDCKILSPPDEEAEKQVLHRRFRADTRVEEGEIDDNLLYPLFRIINVELPPKVQVQKELTKKLNDVVTLYQLEERDMPDPPVARQIFHHSGATSVLSAVAEEQSVGFRIFLVGNNSHFASSLRSALWSIPCLRQRARVDHFTSVKHALAGIRQLSESSDSRVHSRGGGKGVGVDEAIGGVSLGDYFKAEKFERRWKWNVKKEVGFIIVDIPASKQHDEVLNLLRHLPDTEEMSYIRTKDDVVEGPFPSSSRDGREGDNSNSGGGSAMGGEEEQARPTGASRAGREGLRRMSSLGGGGGSGRGSGREGQIGRRVTKRESQLLDEAERVLTGSKVPPSWKFVFLCPQTPLHAQKCGQVASLLSSHRVDNKVMYKPALRSELALALLSELHLDEDVMERIATPPPPKELSAEEAEVRANAALSEAQLAVGKGTVSPGTKSAAYRDLLVIRERLSPAKKASARFGGGEGEVDMGGGQAARFQSRIGKALGSAASSYWKTLRSTVLDPTRGVPDGRSQSRSGEAADVEAGK